MEVSFFLRYCTQQRPIAGTESGLKRDKRNEKTGARPPAGLECNPQLSRGDLRYVSLMLGTHKMSHEFVPLPWLLAAIGGR
jgi:hypothetical protein